MSGDWLDPEWGIPTGLSGFFDSRSSKLAGAPGLARGLDLMEMTKELVKEQYEAKRPDDGIEGVRTAIVIHVERKFLNQVTDPVIEDIWTNSSDVAGANTVLVVYAAPAGGSCSMLLKPESPMDVASIYNFPRFYGIDLGQDADGFEDFIGRPCEVSYLDRDTLSYGLFHKMVTSTSPESPTNPKNIYRNTSGDFGAKNAYNNSVAVPTSVDPFSLVKYAIKDSTSAYHSSVVMAKNSPYGERGGGRIKNNKELQARDKVQIAASYSRFGKKRFLDRGAYRAYVGMIEQATKDGISAPLLRISSAYRSRAHQKTLWDKKTADPKSKILAEAAGESLEDYCQKWVSPPGRSRHHSGRAIDLYLGDRNLQSKVKKLKSSPAFAWLQQNAVFFGFYNYWREPWHWEFNPDARTQRVSDLVSLRSPEPKD